MPTKKQTPIPPQNDSPFGMIIKVGGLALLFMVAFNFLTKGEKGGDGELNTSLLQMNSFDSQLGAFIDDEGNEVEPVSIDEESNVRVVKFFPPENLRFTDWKGKARIYPFFQRSRTFVPRFKLGTPAKSGWYVEFVLDPGTENERVSTVKKDLDKTIKTRFMHTKPGVHRLAVYIKDEDDTVLQTIKHENIIILDKTVAIFGDTGLRGDGIGEFVSNESGPLSKVIKDNLFTFPNSLQDTSFGHGLDMFLEQEFRNAGKYVFPMNLANFNESPGDILSRWNEDGRKDRMFALDGKLEHETFLGVDEIWLGFMHEAVRRGLDSVAFVYELETLIDEITAKGIGTDQIVILLPTFSADYNMKPYIKPLKALAAEKGVRIGPDFYEETRREFGKYVSFDREPLLTPDGMRKIAQMLVEWTN